MTASTAAVPASAATSGASCLRRTHGARVGHPRSPQLGARRARSSAVAGRSPRRCRIEHDAPDEPSVDPATEDEAIPGPKGDRLAQTGRSPQRDRLRGPARRGRRPMVPSTAAVWMWKRPRCRSAAGPRNAASSRSVATTASSAVRTMPRCRSPASRPPRFSAVRPPPATRSTPPCTWISRIRTSRSPGTSRNRIAVVSGPRAAFRSRRLPGP